MSSNCSRSREDPLPMRGVDLKRRNNRGSHLQRCRTRLGREKGSGPNMPGGQWLGRMDIPNLYSPWKHPADSAATTATSGSSALEGEGMPCNGCKHYYQQDFIRTYTIDEPLALSASLLLFVQGGTPSENTSEPLSISQAETLMSICSPDLEYPPNLTQRTAVYERCAWPTLV